MNRGVFSGLLVLLVPAILSRPAEAAKNLPPVACFVVSPGYAPEDTIFAFDASCTTDDKTPLDRLQFRWDVQGDGVWDTGFSSQTTLQVQFGSFGTMTPRLEVIDLSNLAGQFSRDVKVFRNTALLDWGGETKIDVSPLDPQRLALSLITLPGGAGTDPGPYPALASFDGGAQWTQSFGPGPIFNGDTNIGFDSRGDVILSTLIGGNVPAVPGGVVVARSIDGGAMYNSQTYAFDANTIVRMPDGSTRTVCLAAAPYFDFPKLGVDRSFTSPNRDNVYVVTRMKIDRNGDGYCELGWFHAIRRHRPGTADWDPAFIVSDDSVGAVGDFQNVTVASNGTVFLVGEGGSPLCPSGFGVAVLKSTDGGNSFPNPVCALNGTSLIIPDNTWSAVDPSDPSRVYVAVMQFFAQPTAHRSIYVIKSTDAGATWSTPVRVDDVLPDDIVDRWHPALSVSESGRIDIAWFDYRNSTPKTYTGPFQPMDIYYSWSTDGGVSWAPNMRLSPLARGYGVGNDYLSVASSGTRAYVAYSQDQVPGLNLEVYLATIGHKP